MNLTKLFETQRILDARIEKEHPRVEGEDRLAKKILALQVELGELANEWRGFKFWSNDQEPRTSRFAPGVADSYNYNPLLEEYVDCLHFILSIGLELEFTDLCINHSSVERLPEQIDSMVNFRTVFSFVDQLRRAKSFHWYDSLFERFIVLGFSLGFTWEQIEQAYYEKNEINHTRQDSGY